LQDAVLRVELAVHLTNGDRIMFYFERTGIGILQRESCMKRLNAAAAAAQRRQDAPPPLGHSAPALMPLHCLLRRSPRSGRTHIS
jgi:hypothetical protein